DQPRGGHRPAPDHRRPPPVPLVRGVLARGLARGRRGVGEHRPRVCPCPRSRLFPSPGPPARRSPRTPPPWPPRTDPADARRPEASLGSGCACPRPGRVAMKVLLAGGGTAGHVFPAIALAREVLSMGHDVRFVGTIGGQEGPLVSEAGFEFVAV